MPSTLIARFFLAPHDLAGLGVLLQLRAVFLVWEGIELLDAHNRDVFDSALAPRRAQVVVHLPAAEHDTPYLGRIDRVGFFDDRSKSPFRQILERRYRFFVSQHALRR